MDAFDGHAALHRLDHVIDRQAGDRYRGQRFHLHAGLAGNLDRGAHDQAGQLVVGRYLHLNLGDRQRMAKRNKLMRLFGRHDPRDAAGAQHVAFLGIAAEHKIERFGRHDHTAFGGRDAFGGVFVRDIDHARFPAAAEMSELALARHSYLASATSRRSSALVAASTSGCRIRLSPTRKVEMPTRRSRARSAGAEQPALAHRHAVLRQHRRKPLAHRRASSRTFSGHGY